LQSLDDVRLGSRLDIVGQMVRVPDNGGKVKRAGLKVPGDLRKLCCRNQGSGLKVEGVGFKIKG